MLIHYKLELKKRQILTLKIALISLNRSFISQDFFILVFYFQQNNQTYATLITTCFASHVQKGWIL